MALSAMKAPDNDDPRKLRTMLTRVAELAATHSVPSVVVGIAADEGDVHFPDFVDYLQSALRVEDGIFRMTRDRAVLHIADSDTGQAREVLERLQGEFWSQYPIAKPSEFDFRYFAVAAGPAELKVKDVLMAIFVSVPNVSIH